MNAPVLADPLSTPSAARSREAHDILEAFEAAHARSGQADLDQFVPSATHPERLAILAELIRIDMEYGWERGTPTSLEEYRQRYPEIFAAADMLQELAFEEYRLRLQAGERPTRVEFAERFGVLVGDWPEFTATVVVPEARASQDQGGPPTADLIQAARTYRLQSVAPEEAPSAAEFRGPAEAEVFHDLHRADPAGADLLARAMTTMPEMGQEFLGFRLLAELGRGAFGRVFLAEQTSLAQRHVALKVCPDLRGESQTLAQLLHTNVMPIYSLHRSGPFQAVCMPYYGRTTLADVLRSFKDVALPASGRELVSTLKNSQTVPSLGSSPGSGKDSVPGKEEERFPAAPDLPTRVASHVILDKLAHHTYVDAILWIASRLADGLAHAHERGILHRDLKPANILLSDEGQPLLLDFNLAEDTKLRGAAAARVGGTLPYMSPEQLWAMQGEPLELDARSDIYSLGLILYEALTGTPPWRISHGSTLQILQRMIQERKVLPPPLRSRNAAVSPAVETIILKCLEPDPGRRYQSARALQEDLERQLADLPLKHAAEPSRRERLRKFARRHPRLCSALVIGTAAGLLLAATLGVAAMQAHRLKERNVLDRYHAFHDDVRGVQLLLTAQTAERVPWEEAVVRGQQALAPYGVLENDRWQEGEGMRYLPAAEQDRLREDVGTLLFLMTRAELQKSGSQERRAALETALAYNGRAEACFVPQPPTSVLSQRAELLRELGRQEEAERLAKGFKSDPPATARDRILAAREHAAQGRYRQALPLLHRAVEDDPQNLMAWFLLARCHDDLGQDSQAVACYNTCVALWPQSYRLYFNRGLALLRQRAYAQALADFDRSLALEPNQHDAHFNRGLALQGLNRHRDAIADYTKALEQGAPYTRVYFVRARAREMVKDQEGARRDREEGMRLEPTDERSWVARGLARLSTEPARALADFEQALALNPRYRPALDNKAHVLAEVQGRTEEAIAVLDRIIELYPDHVPARSSRGVLFARLGKRDKALADAEESLTRVNDPATQYQVAGIYALTSRAQADDAKEAFRLLSAALRRGYGLDLLARDSDLDPIRERPEFRRLVEAARALQQ